MDSLNTSPFNPTSKRAFCVLFQKTLDWDKTGKQNLLKELPGQQTCFGYENKWENTK